MISKFIIEEPSIWLVKSIIEIKEVSGDYTLEKLREEYPNCLYKKSTEEDWVK
jgi:hypothetical protein